MLVLSGQGHENGLQPEVAVKYSSPCTVHNGWNRNMGIEGGRRGEGGHEEMVKVCPCGARLVKKGYESDKQFSARKYCGISCKGKYHKDPPRPRGFGVEVPRNRNTSRITTGFRAYVENRGSGSGEFSQK